MSVIFEGVDITNDVDVIQAISRDVSGGMADSLDILFSDVNGIWRKWNPQKGNSIIVTNDGYSTGKMTIDEIFLTSGKIFLRAKSTPLEKQTRTKSWNDITFLKLAEELSGKVGLSLKTYNVNDYTYKRVDQIESTDLSFLNYLCVREGYCLKVHDNTAVIYSESYFESLPVAVTLDQDDFKLDSYSIVDNQIFGACNVDFESGLGEYISFTFEAPTKPNNAILNLRMPLFNIGETERFSKSFLRDKNKWEKQCRIITPLNLTVAAGNTIFITGDGIGGKYFVFKCLHNLIGKDTKLYLRGCLEGY